MDKKKKVKPPDNTDKSSVKIIDKKKNRAKKDQKTVNLKTKKDTREKKRRQQKKRRSNLWFICRVLIKAIEIKDVNTAGHSERVSTLTKKITEKLNMNDSVESAEIAGLMHDIGKIAMEKTTLTSKKPYLTPIQLNEIRLHPYIGATLAVEARLGGEISCAIMYHHERYDGNTSDNKYPGYPLGLGGDEIPILARIITVADAFDVLVSGRTYQESVPIEKATSIIRSESGKKFDPKIIRVFVKMLKSQETLKFIESLYK